MSVPKSHLAASVLSAEHIADRQLIAAFILEAATEFSANPFADTSAAAVGHIWGAQAFEFRVLGVQAAGLPCLLKAVSALPGGEPLVQEILRSGLHSLNLFHRGDGSRVVGAVLYGKPNVPLPVFESLPTPPGGRKRVHSAQLDLFAAL
ncbi:hypothetical protein [Methylobacterium oxalidis]|uniref:Uncharacterized protein n=1 Tax=Methylobacterium oxalidis TaxID=944322 RepID=A0A512J3D9_9HYPH|nr:hypothetical protein [Methylobacterium oxalidis]GEP04450.1 hypothetical protein MOX02_24880 [Methylobacterium oxalidis]GJE34644.1 hypothetical protein LDDCCGHA_4856 [Methylobacterium oxalidis]GLS62822.1 hypothetical protein GCM10007888_12030 [Methylobacterium oxalidis]